MASLNLVRQRLKEYAAVTSQVTADRLMRQILDGIARDNRQLILLGRGPDTSSIETLPPVYYMEVIGALFDATKEARHNNQRKRLESLTSTAHANRVIKKAGPAKVGKALAAQIKIAEGQKAAADAQARKVAAAGAKRHREIVQAQAKLRAWRTAAMRDVERQIDEKHQANATIRANVQAQYNRMHSDIRAAEKKADSKLQKARRGLDRAELADEAARKVWNEEQKRAGKLLEKPSDKVYNAHLEAQRARNAAHKAASDAGHAYDKTMERIDARREKMERDYRTLEAQFTAKHAQINRNYRRALSRIEKIFSERWAKVWEVSHHATSIRWCCRVAWHASACRTDRVRRVAAVVIDFRKHHRRDGLSYRMLRPVPVPDGQTLQNCLENFVPDSG